MKPEPEKGVNYVPNRTTAGALKPKQRMKTMMEGKPVDFLPSQLDFVPHRLNALLTELNMSGKKFDAFACNHFLHVFPLTESCYYSSGCEEDEKLVKMAVEKNVIKPSSAKNIVNDNFGVQWLKNKFGIHYVDYPIKDKNIDRFNWPRPDTPHLFEHVTDAIAKKSNELYVVGLHHLLLHERCYLLIGYENFMMSLATDIGFIEDLMDRVTDYHIGLARRFIELGVDAVRTGDDYGTQLGLQVDPKLWRKLYKPRLAELWRIYKEAGVTVMHHSCGNIEAIIPDLIEIGLQLLHPIQPLAMSLEQISKKYGDKLAFHGGIDTQRILPFGTPREVMNAVKYCVETLGANRRYVIAPSQEIMNDVPTDNIRALIDGIYKYRHI